MFSVIKIAVFQAERQNPSQDENWSRIEPRAEVTYFNDRLSDTMVLTERLKGFHIIYAMADAIALPQRELYRFPGIKFIIDERKDGSVHDLSEWLDGRAAEMAEAVDQPDEYNVFVDTIRQGYGDVYEISYLKEVGHYLLAQAELAGPEYRLLCWLFYRGIVDNPGINVPVIPEALPRALPIAELPETFVKGDLRRKLLEKLQKFIGKFKEIYQVDEPVKVVIGGSFADPAKPHPGDIDCIVLVPQVIWDAAPLRFAASFSINLGLEETRIDYKLLPENYSLTSFKAYSDLSLMANKTRFRDVKMAHNFFEKRDLLVLLI